MEFKQKKFYGYIAEFDTPDQILAATNKTREAGYKNIDAYAPYPVHGLAEAVGKRRSRLRYIVLAGGVTGFIAGFLLQYGTAVIDYPLNIGGRPLNSWPQFVPIMFEMTVLFAAFAAVLGMLGLNGLPMPHHPLFSVERFKHATSDKFFLCIEARDPKFDRAEARKFLEQLKPAGVYDVED
jgi:hypothetical protein